MGRAARDRNLLLRGSATTAPSGSVLPLRKYGAAHNLCALSARCFDLHQLHIGFRDNAQCSVPPAFAKLHKREAPQTRNRSADLHNMHFRYVHPLS